MTNKIKRYISIFLAFLFVFSMSSCTSNIPSENSSMVENPSSQSENISENQEEITNINNESIASESSESLNSNVEETIEPSVEENNQDGNNISKEQIEVPVVVPNESETDEYGLTEQQRNSFSMLYYLAITSEEIRISKDNRLILDDIYTSLLNDINPGAIDEETQIYLESLRDTIKSYINISVKRDRLQYIYNQDKAAGIRSAIPDPLAVLSMATSVNWKQLVTSTVFTVVDSYNNFKGNEDALNQQFLMSGWELDDEETEAIQKNREKAFDYMVNIVQEYGLDGKLTLNEKAIESFAEICKIENRYEKIRRLTSEEETYKLLGNYWLELADCYYSTEQYEECLNCVEKYNALSTGIYRKDYNYVQILPKAIVAAQEVCSGEEYNNKIKEFTDSIIENTSTDDWSVRYFAAQVYLDLYAHTNEWAYMEKAYNIIFDNVTVLLDEQRKLNETYLTEIKDIEIKEPDYRFMTDSEKKEAKENYKSEQKSAKAYVKELKNNRKTELPPIYEPLVLNCDLLFALAEKMNISDKEKMEIMAILETDTNGIFLSELTNSRYIFSSNEESYNIEFDKNEIIIPANLLSSGAQVIVKLKNGSDETIFDDCIIDKVERKDESIESFFAYITSKQMKNYKWTIDSEVTVEIIDENSNNSFVFNFVVVEFKDNWIGADKVVFDKK